MLSVIRPDFEVIKEGWILHLVSGYRKFYFSLKIDVIILAPDLTSLILVDSGTFCRDGKGKILAKDVLL
jgi:hypothetical protein